MALPGSASDRLIIQASGDIEISGIPNVIQQPADQRSRIHTWKSDVGSFTDSSKIYFLADRYRCCPRVLGDGQVTHHLWFSGNVKSGSGEINAPLKLLLLVNGRPPGNNGTTYTSTFGSHVTGHVCW